MPETLSKIPVKKKPAASVMRALRERAVGDFEHYGSTRRLAEVYGLSRSDTQDLVIMALLRERKKPLMQRRAKRERKGGRP